MEETLFIHTPQHWSSTGIHHHPSWRGRVERGRIVGEEIKGGESDRDSDYCGPKPQVSTSCHDPFLIGDNTQLLSQLQLCNIHRFNHGWCQISVVTYIRNPHSAPSLFGHPFILEDILNSFKMSTKLPWKINGLILHIFSTSFHSVKLRSLMKYHPPPSTHGGLKDTLSHA